jgi:hypothetical protein
MMARSVEETRLAGCFANRVVGAAAATVKGDQSNASLQALWFGVRHSRSLENADAARCGGNSKVTILNNDQSRAT